MPLFWVTTILIPLQQWCPLTMFVNDFHNTFLSYYFHALITKPTRVFKNKSSLLDNIYTNFSNIAVSGILNPGTPGYRNTYKKTFLVTYL